MKHQMENIKGVVFDFDGTIIISEHLHMRAWEDLSQERSLPLPPGFLEKSVGLADEELALDLCHAWNGALTKAEILKQKRQFYMSRTKTECELVPGVVEVIKKLHSTGRPLAVATSSSREEVLPILESFQLKQFFKKIWTVDDVKCPKPNPEIYVKAAESIGFETKDCLAFEDSKVGVQSARSSGCVLVTVQTLYDEKTLGAAWFSIKDFNDEKLTQFIQL